MSDPVKILHLISGLGVGGAEMMLLWTARLYERRSCDIMIVSLMSGGSIAALVRGEGVQVVELGQKRGRLSPRALIRLWKQAKAFSPHIIQGHLFHSNLVSRFLSLLVPGACSVCTRHNETDSPFRTFLYKITAPLGKGTIVFSEPVRRHVLKDSSSGGPVFLAPYGIDPEKPSKSRTLVRAELEMPSDAFVWIAVGRLTRQKGFDILIEAFSSLCQRMDSSSIPRPVLLIVGEGEEREALEKQLSQVSIDSPSGESLSGGSPSGESPLGGSRAVSVQAGAVRFLGQRDDIPALLAACDAFVLSSRWEGGPLVVLEAMAAGLPVVATRVGDAPNMIIDDPPAGQFNDQPVGQPDSQTGVLVQPEDALELTGAMARIMEDELRARQWGLKGKERMLEKYSYSRTQRSMEQFYTELVGQRGEK